MLIDDREPDWVKNHDWGFNTQIERLDVADFITSGGVAIERKEINDMVSSLDQRVWEQAKDLEGNSADDGNGIKVGVIIIHGSVSDLSPQNMDSRKIEGIYGAVARLTISYGISVLWFRERSQFIKMVKKYNEKGGTESSMKKPHLTKRSYRDDRINVLYGIDGLGYKTINNILDEFDSLYDIAQAPKKNLKKADGVGPSTAENIYDAFHQGREDGKLI